MTPPVVLYTYNGSVSGDKIINILKLKNIPYSRVDVPDILPRPEVSDLLGIAYRRIPMLAIGNDVYCDSSLIASALERKFSKADGYLTLFPARKGGSSADTGMIKAFSMYYADRTLFSLAIACLPLRQLGESFIKDRSDYIGAPIVVEIFENRLPLTKSSLSAHLALLEEQLADSREWLFDTESPSLADISTHSIYFWSMPFPALEGFYDPQVFPKVLEWISRMTKFLQAQDKPPTLISGQEAAQMVSSSAFDDYVGFDPIDAGQLGIEIGQIVSIAPNDTGRNYPTTGKLVGLNGEEFVLETRGSSGSLVRCHFPRLNFDMNVVTAN